MKIRTDITAVEDGGDSLTVTSQGSCDSDAQWMAQQSITFKVPATDRNRRAFRLGRELVFTVEVRK